MLVPVMSGAILGGLLVVIAGKRGSRGEAQILAIGLVIAAFIYVVLAALADRTMLVHEVIGLLVFGALAWLGMRISSFWLALGWAAHAAWDIGLHLDRLQAFVPAWYPELCVGLDLVVAGSVVGAVWRTRV